MKRFSGRTNGMTEMCKAIATVQLIIGGILFLLSLIVSDYNRDFFLTMLSLGVMGSAMVMFGFGLFMGLLEEYSISEKEYY
ncbi:MFS transporter [Bacillus songklensis]|uniref:MFS transporter n=1 Tax=Bacillus songklensis TaxID=1069116 RepID=A0ABV8BA12_9BACI